MAEILRGIDWASDHHDVALIDPEGTKLGRRRISDDAAGLGELTGMFAAHGGGPDVVKIAIETERGLLVASLRAAGYEIHPINPQAVDRYRDRHHLARASLMRPMRWCWLTSCGPTLTCTGRCPLTARKPRRSRCSPAPART